MSTFLQLCQRVRMECGVAGEGLPSAVTGQTGIMGKIVQRTQRAWVDIQASRPYWKFAHSTLNFPTVVGQRTYDVVADLVRTDIDKWDEDSAFIYLTSAADQTRLSWKDYQWFIRHIDPTYPSNRPGQIAELPGRILGFDLTPDAIYTVNIDFWKTPELLAANGDTPCIPEHYHDIIVWRAVMMYFGAEQAVPEYQNARTNYIPMYNQLVVDQGDVPTERKHFPLTRGR